MSGLSLVGVLMVALGSFIIGLQAQSLAVVIACPAIAVGGVLIRAGWD